MLTDIQIFSLLNSAAIV